MNDTIFLNTDEGELTELKETLYDSEDNLQELIEKNPILLAGSQINPEIPRKWILISREMGVPDHENGTACWYLDHLFIDQDGIPTLVEVKRSTDTRIRREVVGQMLDYAANASAYWTISDIQSSFDGDLKSAFGEEVQEELYWENVSSNLKLGKLRLIFAADTIPENLRRIIEFLNNQMQNSEVLGLEIKQYMSQNKQQIFVPKIIGRTLQAVETKKAPAKSWDYDSFLQDVQRVGNDETRALTERIIKDFKAFGCRIWYGKGRTHGSIIIVYDAENGKSMQLFGVYPWTKHVLCELEFQYFKEPYDNKEAKAELKQRFEEILGISVPENRLNGRPSFKIDVLYSAGRYDRLIALYKEMVENFKTTNMIL